METDTMHCPLDLANENTKDILLPGSFSKSRDYGEVYSDNINEGPAFNKKLCSEFFQFWESEILWSSLSFFFLHFSIISTPKVPITN